MFSILYIFLIIVALFIIVAVVWRIASKRRSIPCPVWMKWMLDPSSSGHVSTRTRRTVGLLSVHPGMKVLDAGCGPGRLSLPLAEATAPGGEVTAVDVQEGMLEEVRMRAQKRDVPNIRFIHAGLGDGALETDYYDRAVLITVLGEIPEREAALQEIYDALVPGGILLIEETIRDPHFQTRNTVTTLAGAVGFIEDSFTGSRFTYTLLFRKPVSDEK